MARKLEKCFACCYVYHQPLTQHTFRNHDFPKKVPKKADPPWFIHSMKRCLDKWILLNLIKSDPPPTHPLSNMPKKKKPRNVWARYCGLSQWFITCICFTLVVARCDFHHKLQHQHDLISISPFTTKPYGNNFSLQSRYDQLIKGPGQDINLTMAVVKIIMYDVFRRKKRLL